MESCSDRKHSAPDAHRNGAGAATVSLGGRLPIVFQADFQLPNRFVGRAERVHTVSAEIVRRVIQVFPGSLKRGDRLVDLGMRLRRW
jgi:hypothetical protein